MASKTKTDTLAQRVSEKVDIHPSRPKEKFHYCTTAPKQPRAFGPEVHSNRMRLIDTFDDKWVNETVLHYYFFDRDSDGQHVFLADGSKEWRSWKGDGDQKEVVRRGFNAWLDLDIGIKFEQVDSRYDAEIRIGFMAGDGAWSYLGRQILAHGPDERGSADRKRSSTIARLPLNSRARSGPRCTRTA